MIRSTSANQVGCQGATHWMTKDTVLTFNPATDAAGLRCIEPTGEPLKYVVTQPSQGTGTTVGGDVVTYTPSRGFTGVTFFTVKACNPSGVCSFEVGVRVNVQSEIRHPSGNPDGSPEPPAIAYSTALTGRRVRVTWTNAGNDIRYQVQRCRRTPSGTCFFSTIAFNRTPETPFIDTPVIFPGTYRFRVRACKDRACSAYTEAPDIMVR